MLKKITTITLLSTLLYLTPPLAAVPNYFHKKGTLKEEQYSSPQLFSLELPRFMGQPCIEERVSEDMKEVILFDKNSLFHIGYLRLDKEEKRVVRENGEALPELFSQIIDARIIPMVSCPFDPQKSFSTQLLRLEDGRQALFMYVAEPSSLDEESRDTAELATSFLLFPWKSDCLILSYQCKPSTEGEPQTNFSKEEHLALLLKAAQSCQMPYKKSARRKATSRVSIPN